jgi:hypothetical protein
MHFMAAPGYFQYSQFGTVYGSRLLQVLLQLLVPRFRLLNGEPQ